MNCCERCVVVVNCAGGEVLEHVGLEMSLVPLGLFFRAHSDLSRFWANCGVECSKLGKQSKRAL